MILILKSVVTQVSTRNSIMLRSSNKRQQQQITSLQRGKENAVTFNVTKNSQAIKTLSGNALRDLTKKTPHLKATKYADAEKRKADKKVKTKKAQKDVPDI